MAKKRRWAKPRLLVFYAISYGAVFLSLAAYAPLAAWWNNISAFGRVVLVGMIAFTAMAGVGAILAIGRHRAQQRAIAWHKAMASWSEHVKVGAIFAHQTARYLSALELERFAAQLYSQMGYTVKRTGRTGDHGVDVELINPQGRVELVQCKQWRKPVGEPEVRDLFGAMAHVRAARGWLWAPGGFSIPAMRWAKNKPIVLVDDDEIGRLIESSYGE